MSRNVPPANTMIASVKTRWLLYVGMILFILVTRIENHAEFLYGWDSVQFALSIENYNVKAHQPHPPGYLLYCFVLKIFNAFTHDHNHTILTLNVLAEILTCLFIGLTIFELLPQASSDQKATLAAAGSFLYATNPISWFYSSVAEIYAMEGLLVSLCIYLFIRTLKEEKYLIYGSAAIAIAGGFRPTTEVFLIPIYIFSLFRVSKHSVLLSLVVFVIGNLLWFLPTATFYGGVKEFFETLLKQFENSTAPAIPFVSKMGLLSIKRVAYDTLQALTLPLAIAILFRISKLNRKILPVSFGLFLIAPILFFSLIHFPKDGYFLLLIPVLVMTAVLLIGNLYRFKFAIGILIFSAILNVWLYNHRFGALKRDVFTESFKQLGIPNRNTILRFNHDLSEFLRFASDITDRKIFIHTPEGFPDWRIVMYYFPNDEAILLLPSANTRKRWACFAEQHKSEFIHTELIVDPTVRTAIFVAGEPPPVAGQLIRVGDTDYRVSRRREWPPELSLDGFRFVQRD